MPSHSTTVTYSEGGGDWVANAFRCLNMYGMNMAYLPCTTWDGILRFGRFSDTDGPGRSDKPHRMKLSTLSAI